MVSVRAPKSRTSTYSLEVLPSVMSGNHQPLAYKSAWWHSCTELLGVDQINNRYEVAVSVTNYGNENYCSHVSILTPKKQTSVPVTSELGKLQQLSITSRALAGFWMLTSQWASRTGPRDFLQRLLSLYGQEHLGFSPLPLSCRV